MSVETLKIEVSDASSYATDGPWCKATLTRETGQVISAEARTTDWAVRAVLKRYRRIVKHQLRYHQ